MINLKAYIADALPLPAWSVFAGMQRALGFAPRPAPTPAAPRQTAFAADPAAARAQVSLIHTAGRRPNAWRPALAAALDNLTGPGPVIKRGDRVVIKVSLVGGRRYGQKAVKDYGRLPTELYWTHPEVAGAVGEWARDAGAAKVIFVEALSDNTAWRQFGYHAVAARLGAEFIDLNEPGPYPDFAAQPVGPDALVYDQFTLNRILVDADVFISVPKVKRHHAVGVTAALKNLVGILPVALYRDQPSESHRSALHHQPGGHSDLARAVVDLARARPIHLAVIDGLQTTLGSEGPWNNDLRPLALETLVASRNAVAADAVAVQALGLDPVAADFHEPFGDSLNYLRLADTLGLGPHRPAEIALAQVSV